MTINGVKLFYPFSTVKCVFPFEVNNPHRYRIHTGSKQDRMLAVIFLAGCLPTFVIAYEGYERFVRSTQQNIDAAVRDYNEFSRDHLVYARLGAYNALTKEPLTGDFEIIGALNPHCLVFKGPDGRAHTLGREFQSDFVAGHIECSRGVGSRSSVRSIDMSNQLLSQVISSIDTASENYFFGDLSTPDKVSLPENIRIFTPITGGGSTIKLNFATYDDIRTFNLETIYLTKGILTIKTLSTGRPGSANEANGTGLPKPGTFIQITALLEARESVIFLKAKGDTVRANELLAKKSSAHFFEDEISLNRERIAALGNASVAALSDVDQKIETAERSVNLDSLEYAHACQLVRKGYVSANNLPAVELRWRKESRILSGLMAARSNAAQKENIEVRKLQIQNEQLEARARTAELQSEIRSTENGVLLDIRQTARENKMQVTFIIRRIP
jgi:hypothetical protein